MKNHGGFAYYRPGNAIFPRGLRKPPGHAHYQGGLHNSKIERFMPGLILISGLAFQNQSKKHCIEMPLAALNRIEMKTNQRSRRMEKPEGNYQGHDMAGDTSVAEGLQGWSGRPRRRRFGGCLHGRERIAPVAKMGTNGNVRMWSLQWVCQC